MVAWCTSHVDGVGFVRNRLDPPLTFPEGEFDAVYAVSVITHLSEPLAEAWVTELERVLARDGLLLLWTNGNPVAGALLADERRLYEAGHCVTRGGIKQGRKWYLAFHPDSWVRSTLLRSFVIVDHLRGGFSGVEQDIWVARRQ